MIGRLSAVGGFFALRIGCALILLKVAASRLSVAGFADFTQYLAFGSVAALLAIAGTQNGLIRQVAAARSRVELADTMIAAGAIWLAASATLFAVAALAAPAIATILVGHQDMGSTVILLTAAAIFAGPGQMRCSMLTGQGRIVPSLAIQSAGLLAGAAGAAWFALRGDAASAAVAFACGSIVPSIPAFAALTKSFVVPAPATLVAHARQLLRFSLAFAAVAAAIPLSLLALRWQYRGAFGSEALGHWLSANRISDLSTQLIGLFVMQIFVPQLTRLPDEAARRRFTLICGAAGMAVMSLPLLAFTVASEPLVRLFLSPEFVPAIPAIRTYMAGDMLRVWTSLAIYTAFAAGRAERYAAIELAVVGAITIATSVLIGRGFASAPQWVYFLAHAAFSVGFVGFLLMSWRSAAADRMADAVSFTSKISAKQS